MRGARLRGSWNERVVTVAGPSWPHISERGTAASSVAPFWQRSTSTLRPILLSPSRPNTPSRTHRNPRNSSARSLA